MEQDNEQLYRSDGDGGDNFFKASDNVKSSRWKTVVEVSGESVDFKVDTGADVKIITQQEYQRHFSHIVLRKPTTPLVMTDSSKLSSLGYFPAEMKKLDRMLREKIYVVAAEKKNLLGHRASELLGIMKFIRTAEKDFPELFSR